MIHCVPTDQVHIHCCTTLTACTHTHTQAHTHARTHTHTHTGERQTRNGSACVYQYNLQFFTYYRKMAESQVLLKDWPLH